MEVQLLEKIAVLLFLTRLYVAWHRIHLYLVDREIDYKIYDSIEDNVWCKPKLMLSRDLLIARFQVRPILTRIEQTIFLLLLLLSLNFPFLFFSIN